MAVRVYDHEQAELDRFHEGLARQCGALAGAVQSLLEASEEIEHLAARAVARKALDDYEAWLKIQTEVANLDENARGRGS